MSTLLPAEVAQLKNVLYETLEVEPERDEKDVSLDQRLGVNISSAIKKDGVNIIQLQSNIDNRKVTHNIIKALKIVDNLHTSLLPGVRRIDSSKELEYQTRIKELEYRVEELQSPGVAKVDDYVISDVVNWYFDSDISLHDFLEAMKKKFVEIAISKSRTDKEAAGRLGVKNTTMPGMKRRLGIMK